MSRTLQEGCEQYTTALILNESNDTLLAGFIAAWPLMVSSNVDFNEMLPWELKRTSARPLQQTTLTGWPQQKKQKVGSAAEDEEPRMAMTLAQWMDGWTAADYRAGVGCNLWMGCHPHGLLSCANHSGRRRLGPAHM